MRRWMRWACLACALLVCLPGCEEVETELTLNADGSGKMVQRVTLSAAGYSFLSYAARRGKHSRDGYTPVLTEEGLKRWREAHPQSSVKVVAFSSKVADDGSFRGECEVTFGNLQEFARSVWGWPLRLAVARDEKGTAVQIGDPVRGALRHGPSELRAILKARPAHELQVEEYLGTLDVLRQTAQGMRIRTVVRVPGLAVSADGAVLSADGTTVTYELTLGEEHTPVDAWRQGSPVTVVFPGDGLKVDPFAEPDSVASGPDAGGKIIEAELAAGFHFEPSEASVRRSRQINYQSDRTYDRDELNIGLNLYVPEGTKLLRMRDETLRHRLLIAQDGEGNDVRRKGERHALNFSPHSRRAQHGGNARWVGGTLHVRLTPPARRIEEARATRGIYHGGPGAGGEDGHGQAAQGPPQRGLRSPRTESEVPAR